MNLFESETFPVWFWLLTLCVSTVGGYYFRKMVMEEEVKIDKEDYDATKEENADLREKIQHLEHRLAELSSGLRE